LFQHSKKKALVKSCSKGYTINRCGFGMLSSINSRISEQMEIAVLTILWFATYSTAKAFAFVYRVAID
jgi:hypothetical protein